MTAAKIIHAFYAAGIQIAAVDCDLILACDGDPPKRLMRQLIQHQREAKALILSGWKVDGPQRPH